ncbi:MAG: acyl-[acyl-carrier-protein] thioesterase [Lachnospiraceae bacterium]|nr:acyl-[acyl-carrier-protein] thioesterase [Lachnospiraceae bacterium]
MIYTFDSRVRYSETRPDGRMSLHALMNYLQDCSTFQSEELGVGVKALHRIGRAWVLVAWQIRINRYPVFGERITIGTKATEHDRLIAQRNFFIRDKEGEFLVKANSCWTYVDRETGHAQLLTEACLSPYGQEPPLDMPMASRKIRLPKGEAAEGIRLEVTKEHLDSNEHVNNGQYIRIAENALPRTVFPLQVRAEYRRAAFLGDEMIPWLYETETGYVVALKNPAGEIFSVVEFTLD